VNGWSRSRPLGKTMRSGWATPSNGRDNDSRPSRCFVLCPESITGVRSQSRCGLGWRICQAAENVSVLAIFEPVISPVISVFVAASHVAPPTVVPASDFVAMLPLRPVLPIVKTIFGSVPITQPLPAIPVVVFMVKAPPFLIVIVDILPAATVTKSVPVINAFIFELVPVFATTNCPVFLGAVSLHCFDPLVGSVHNSVAIITVASEPNVIFPVICAVVAPAVPTPSTVTPAAGTSSAAPIHKVLISSFGFIGFLSTAQNWILADKGVTVEFPK
jgi:hypothetical protein